MDTDQINISFFSYAIQIWIQIKTTFPSSPILSKIRVQIKSTHPSSHMLSNSGYRSNLPILLLIQYLRSGYRSNQPILLLLYYLDIDTDQIISSLFKLFMHFTPTNSQEQLQYYSPMYYSTQSSSFEDNLLSSQLMIVNVLFWLRNPNYFSSNTLLMCLVTQDCHTFHTYTHSHHIQTQTSHTHTILILENVEIVKNNTFHCTVSKKVT